MRFTSRQVAFLTGGHASDPDIMLDGATTDSRRVRRDNLFIPLLRGTDGHEWIASAVQAGAAAYLTEQPEGDDFAIHVADTNAALRALALYGRSSLRARAIGITGSVGKTTTKDLIYALLAPDFRTHASKKSYNNDIGVPESILDAPQDTERLVLEVGASAPGEIAGLCLLAAPDIGVVTRVAPAHTLGFGDIDGVARAKAELIEALPLDGLAVLNADDPRVAAMAGHTQARVLQYGQDGDVQVRVVDLDAEARPRIRMATPWGEFAVKLRLHGAHQATCAAAAVAVAGATGISIESIAERLAAAEGPAMRMQVCAATNGSLLIDDSYNANPASVEAALRALLSFDRPRRYAVLGQMAELGNEESAEHERIGALARELGITVISVAAPLYGVDNVQDVGEAVARLHELDSECVVLVKGSRVAGLERVVISLSVLSS